MHYIFRVAISWWLWYIPCFISFNQTISRIHPKADQAVEGKYSEALNNTLQHLIHLHGLVGVFHYLQTVRKKSSNTQPFMASGYRSFPKVPISTSRLAQYRKERLSGQSVPEMPSVNVTWRQEPISSVVILC